MREVIIDGVRFLAQEEHDEFTVEITGVMEANIDGKARYFLEINRLPRSDYGRLGLKSGQRLRLFLLPVEKSTE